ncbi:e3 ubiquitin-protein ligase upl6 [Nicotiana attenuata]|uniref:HECT-type E3 ubiquitin transferase n=1 Tax=Nicotiana attenuata TaxID=49451 RepID=A0A1J6I7B6_NICAT|nr:e3 ubiquitin-protein ligase upl6 [Nicotiana attenuata]
MGDVVSLFAGMDCASDLGLVRYRLKKFVRACIRAVYGNRNKLRDQLFMESEKSCTSAILLLDAVTLLIVLRFPWACSSVTYLLQRNIYSLFREIILIGKERNFPASNRVVSSFERVLGLIIPHVGQSTCSCASVDPRCCFPSQILTIPFLWRFFTHPKEVFASPSVSRHYFHQMALCMKEHVNVLPPDIEIDLPGYASPLGNLLEVARLAFALPESFTMAVDFATVATFLLEALPSLQSSNIGVKKVCPYSSVSEDDMVIDDEQTEIVLNLGLEQQITNAIDPHFLLQLTTVLLGGFSPLNGLHSGQLDEKHVAAVSALCAFLHVTFNILPLERIMTVLAYRTELVAVLWNFMKQCHENQKWSSLSEQSAYLPAEALDGCYLWLFSARFTSKSLWLQHIQPVSSGGRFLQLSCMEKPLSLKDIRCLIVILRQALWQLLWLNPMAPANFCKSTTAIFAMKKHPLEFLQHRVSVVASELLSQLQDWNNRWQFTPPSEFHADGVNEYFISQAMTENTRANDILKQAPFLVPFTSRAKIFTSQLAAARERNGSQEDLRGLIRVTFVNELGVEEAGIDGGGIFKDFMENITRAAFDVQYGLFKETADNLIYPNPGSGMSHHQHLQYFHFHGTVLAKVLALA